MKTGLKLAAILGLLILTAHGRLLYRELELSSAPAWREERLARRMVDRARSSVARRYMARETEEAYRTYWRGRRIEAIQDTKPWVLKDFDHARSLYFQAYRQARGAYLRSVARDRDMKRKAEEAIVEAEALTHFARDIYVKAQLGAVFIQNIAFAEMYLTESRACFKQKDYAKSADRAGESYKRADQSLSAIGSILNRFYDPQKIRHWRALLTGAVEYSRDTGKVALVAIKDQRILRLYRFGQIAHSYRVELGKNPLQQKLRSGDLATPEGQYIVSSKKSGRQTKYYLALLLNYPNPQDWERFNEAKRRGQIPARAQIGGLIEIHGDGGKGGDWTEGCVAMTNEDMREVFNQVEVGTPVIIIGSDGFSQTLSQLKGGRTWKNGKTS
jgi:hypothetical protein